MNITLPLDEMTTEEKLRLLETIWDDLSRHPDQVEPPAWHGEALAGLEAALERGEETFEDWESAKRRIRDNMK